MTTSRALSDLHPKVMQMALRFIAACKDQGIDIIITSTYRSMEAQAQLYAQGRSTTGKRVTNAKPGFSMHNHRLAFDFAPMKSGKIDWADVKLFKRCGEIAVACGLTWGGNFESFVDYPHCEYTGGLTLEQIRNGAKVK